MSEPCPKCERDYTTAQAMKSYIDAAKIAGDAAIERDKALAALANIHDLADDLDFAAAEQMTHAAYLAQLGTSDSVRPHARCLARAQVYTEAADLLRAALDTP